MLDAISATEPEMILHLGDYDKDCAAITMQYPQIPLRSVRGNCDYSSSCPVRDEFVIDGKRFLMTHGHQFHVKTGLSTLVWFAKTQGYDIVLFGHTHIQHYSDDQGVILINPGTISTMKSVYAVLEISNGVLTYDFRHA